MSQETNLNVAPYFDDYNEPVIGGKAQDYYKVLFKPGYPVQARELTTLQSMLQNQVEQFGNHFFKEGAKVIPGNLMYIQDFYAVEIESDYLGIPVSTYADDLVGIKIRGQTSGVVAVVKKVLSAADSDRGNITLYVDYYASNRNDSTRDFNSGETLITDSNITFGNTFITAGEGFANTIVSNATSTGSAFALSSGVYFLRGYLVDVDDEILLLDQYSNKPSYRVGLDVIEEIINADIDPNLNDNANGFNNYAAPGADRLKITAKLAKHALDSFDNPGFVELANVQNGVLRRINDKTDYNLLADEFARRTFDESGNYYIKAFETYVKESLNDGKGNNGIYNENQLTSTGQRPTEDLLVYKITPGKAYVKGYEIDTIASTFVDAPKPRTTQTLENQAIEYSFGSTFRLNRVSGSPSIGVNTSSTISLRAERVGISSYTPSGKEIGIGRVYDFALEGGSYESTNYNLNRWDVALYDVQTFGDLEINENVTLTIPTHIKGDSSGATAFLRHAVSAGTALTVYQISGNFINGEKLIFDNTAQSRVSIGWTNYGMGDVQSVHATVGAGNTFSGDVIPTVSTLIGDGTATFTGTTNAAGTISTITNPLLTWPGIVTSGDLLSYTRSGYTTPSYVKVDRVNTNDIVVSGVTTVAGVADGGLSHTDINVTDLSLLYSKLQATDNNEKLFAPLPKKNVESVGLTTSSIIVRKEYDSVSITNNSTNTLSAGTDLTFLPFDEERYVLTRSDGSTEKLTSDRFVLTNGSNNLTINGLGANDTGARLIATLRKDSVTSKSKRLSPVDVLVVNKSTIEGAGIGSTTRNDGLTYGNYPYGTRVQDEKICLNVPDVIKIHGVYESNDTGDATLPNLTLGSLDGPTAKTDDLIVGDEFVGSVSGARGLYAVRVDSNKISFTYLNKNTFEEGEIVSFIESGVNGIAGTLDQGDTNIVDNYSFYNGQTLTYYDYSYLLRKQGVKAPTRSLKIVSSKGYYESSDTGDVTTANSYEGFNYGNEIQRVSHFRNTDIIDVRPRVNDYTLSEGSASPFEFDGRSFNAGNHSSNHVFASDESETITFSYYLPRLDRLYLTKEGVFQLKLGEAADEPKLPGAVNDALNIANIALPPYLYDVKNAQVTFVNHKRYQMSDIYKLENRIKNLEYYTTLSLLENNTASLFLPDEQGVNRFKSGFMIDNFSSVGVQDNNVGVKNSLDLQNLHLRPSHFTTSVSLELGSDAIAGLGTTTNSQQDFNYLSNITGTNIKRTGQVVTLDYDDTLWLEQPFATRVENVTPYLVKNYDGDIELDPGTDVWIDVNRLQLRDVMMEGSFQGVADALQAEVTDMADGSRVGQSPVIWNSWETNNVRQNLGMTLGIDVQTTLNSEVTGWRDDGRDRDGGQVSQATGFQIHARTEADVWGSVSLDTNLDQRRTGIQHNILEQIDTESFGDRVVSREIVQFMRRREIQFTARRMKPNTQVYAFFDGVDINQFMTPKLLEIAMTEGTFQIGETVIGVMPISETIPDNFAPSVPYIEFRVATANHKYGPYNQPTDWYGQNPYDRENVLPSHYSSTTSVLNVDCFSLANELQPQFWGWVRQGMILRGQSSGAVATLTNVRFVADDKGTVIGCYMVPDGNIAGNPIFETGRSTFRLTSSSTNDRTGGVVTTSAEEIFYSEGSIDTTQETTLSLRNARVEHQDFEQTRTLSVSSSAEAGDSSTSTSTTTVQTTRTQPPRRDPLAQSFYVDDKTGIFVTKVDLYFRTKDDTLPVFVQLREIQTGLPTTNILPFADIEIASSDVNLSDDGSVATTVTFDSPVYLNGEREYALVLLSDSTDYTAWISRIGEADLTNSSNQEAGTILVTAQPLLGSLFKSQNASTWDASQYEDLKFKLYRATFDTSGSVQFFNPKLPTDVELLRQNPFDIDSRTLRIGIGTTVQDTDFTLGNQVIQLKSDATGTYVGSAGTAKTIQITNPGIGYTPSSGGTTYSDVTLTNVTGNGRNGTANITISAGVAVGATIADGGTGYAIGDMLTCDSIGIASVGRDIRLSVQQINGSNEITLDEVQGDFTVGAGYTLTYINPTGLTTDLNAAYSGNVVPTGTIQTVYDGLHFKVNQRNHGMHSDVNQVTIQGAKSDVSPTTLSASYSSSFTGNISIGATSNFEKFENVSVASSNPGFAKIGSEIIKYTGVNADSELTGITRAQNGTVAFPHDDATLVYKYEMNGVSLLRINKTHTLNEASISDQIGLDYYYLKVDVSEDTDQGTTNRTGASFPQLYFNETKKIGGSDVKATYNVPFDMVTPEVQVINPKYTTIASSVRTVTGQSVSGTESPYLDKGFQSIALNTTNYFDSPRILASKINEDARLTNMPGKKSFTLNMDFLTTDSTLSPMVDLTKTNVIFTSNRINRPITNYVSDKRANTIQDDPNAFYYVSRPIELENSASTIKVFITASVHESNDIRAFYAIQNDKSADVIFTPFPGYDNLNSQGSVIDPRDNNGKPDALVTKNSYYDFLPTPRSFKEYVWTAEKLPSFAIFRVKLVMTSTNQSMPPTLQDLRVIALA